METPTNAPEVEDPCPKCDDIKWGYVTRLKNDGDIYTYIFECGSCFHRKEVEQDESPEYDPEEFLERNDDFW